MATTNVPLKPIPMDSHNNAGSFQVVLPETVITHRTNVIAADAGNPAQNSGADMTFHKYANVWLKVLGGNSVTVTVTITPLFWSAAFGVYAEGVGESFSVTMANPAVAIVKVFNMLVNGSPDFFIRVDALTGSGATLNIAIGGV